MKKMMTKVSHKQTMDHDKHKKIFISVSEFFSARFLLRLFLFLAKPQAYERFGCDGPAKLI